MEEQSLYRVYSQWLRERYGSKVYKLPVNVPVSCPNRDGTAGKGGCIYCGAKGGGNETLSDTLSVAEQVEKNRAYIAKRYKAKLIISSVKVLLSARNIIALFQKSLERLWSSSRAIPFRVCPI